VEPVGSIAEPSLCMGFPKQSPGDMMRRVETFLSFCLSIISPGLHGSAYAQPSAHFGLLSSDKMAIVLENARTTRRLLLPEQQISACSAFDEPSRNPLSGTALCTIATPHILNGNLQVSQGPDLYCSYLTLTFCDVQAAKLR
jgi:hypothetical protein